MILRAINNESELKQFQKYMISVYGEDQEPYNVTLDWWKNYPRGYLALFRGHKIIGSFSILPLSKLEYEILCSGYKKERELKTLKLGDEKCSYWHISNIHLTDELRVNNYIQYFMDQIKSILLASGNFPNQIYVSALIFSEDGMKFFTRLGFKMSRKSEQMPDYMPLYTAKLLYPFFK
jgi:hypothetical protein